MYLSAIWGVKMNCFIHTWLISTAISTTLKFLMRSILYSQKIKHAFQKGKGKYAETFCLEPTTFSRDPRLFIWDPRPFSQDPRLFSRDPRLFTHDFLPTTFYPRLFTHDFLPTTHGFLPTTHGFLPTTFYPRPTTFYPRLLASPDRNKVVEHDRNDSYLGLIQTVHLN